MPMPDLPGIEREVAAGWASSKLIGRSLAQRAGGPRWPVYAEPAAASGVPGIHQVRSQAVNDVYPRFKTMQGYHVPLRSGLNCHGLGVEVAVATELGLASASEIAAYGIEQFIARCQEFALRHAAAFDAVASRMGYLIDPAQAYRTMDASYIESVWWSLARIFDAGLLVRGYRLVRYCPRCQTPLAEHELRRPGVFRSVQGSAVVVRFRLDKLPSGASLPRSVSRLLRGADLLVWTAEPWTLVANTGVAVDADETYAIARRAGEDDRVVVAEPRLHLVLDEGWHTAARVTGSELSGASYRSAFPFGPVVTAPVVTAPVVTAPVVSADSVNRTGRGTGLTHLAPAFGIGNLPSGPIEADPIGADPIKADPIGADPIGADPIGPDGCFDQAVPGLGGLFFADADPAIVADLSDRGLLFAARPHQRRWPHCWRCATPLLNRAMRSWYIKTSAISDLLRDESEQVAWQPWPAGGQLSFGLPGPGSSKPAADWTLSRTRYWGTPLPLWECSDRHITCVSSLAELSELAGRYLASIDPHQLTTAGIGISCPRCGAPARWVAEVIDPCYDSGAMPFARCCLVRQGNADPPPDFPAQLAVAHTEHAKSWFYSAIVIGTLTHGRAPFLAAICPDGVLDAQGQPMSGGQGNLVDPLPLIERHGADALRWYFAAATPRQRGLRALESSISIVARNVLHRYWHAARFFCTYSGQTSPVKMPPGEARPVLDRWLLSELQVLVGDVTSALDAFRCDTAAHRLANFIGDLSRWYLRLSRRRFAVSATASQRAAAGQTLGTCLEVLTRLMAPFAPFLADHVWWLIRTAGISDAAISNAAISNAAISDVGTSDSVHLAPWPQVREPLLDERLNEQMVLVRRMARLGRAARAAAQIANRQPLARARITTSGFPDFDPELLALLVDELNVKSIEQPSPAWASPGWASPAWAVAKCAVSTVALDVTITPELRREGVARRAIRIIQDARRRSGLAVTDQIALLWETADEEISTALAEHGARIRQAVRAADYFQLAAKTQASTTDFRRVTTKLGVTFWLKPL
jgi:isoleucyl-tRNA synthetase